MKYSIAAVSFLNTIPLIDQLLKLPKGEIDLRLDLPSRLAELLEAGTVDVALVPVVEAFRGRSAGLIPGTGIACRGAVDSVRLFYRGPLSGLSRVQADRGSRSSVALLSVLLKEMHNLQPLTEEFVPTAGYLPQDGEGVLVIGDRCFELEKHLAESGETEVENLDLGQAWWDLTGLPFVFAAWAVSHDFYERASTVELAELIGLLGNARDAGLNRLDELATREAAAGRLGYKGEATVEAVAYYFKESLRYRLEDPEMAGMARFHELCIKHGIVPPGPLPLLLRG